MANSVDNSNDFNIDNFLILEEEPTPATTHSWEIPEIDAAREKDREGRYIEVVILVKTMPQLSKKYRDTVCVAGLALEPLRWVRLYPVPFRYLDQSKQFKKYSIIRVKVYGSENDRRFESLKIDRSTISTIKELSTDNGWRARAHYVEQIEEISLCTLRRNLNEDINGPSLALLRPRDGRIELTLRKSDPETEEQRNKRELILQDQAEELEIFETKDRERLVKLAEPPRLSGKIHFYCHGEESCTGHTLGFIDWEFAAAQHHRADWTEEELRDFLIEKFETTPSKPEKDLRLFLGNLANPRKRQNYQVLGLYYPEYTAASDERYCLF